MNFIQVIFPALDLKLILWFSEWQMRVLIKGSMKILSSGKFDGYIYNILKKFELAKWKPRGISTFYNENCLFRELLISNLESRGILSKIKADLRAAIFQCLDEKSNHQLLSAEETQIPLSLCCDLLDKLGLLSTSKVNAALLGYPHLGTWTRVWTRVFRFCKPS